MSDRRSFIAGMLAAGLVPKPTWAEVGNPAFLSAARTREDEYALFGLRSDGDVAFSLPLPARGHAAAAHPSRAEAVAFARRPGTFAIVIDCMVGDALARLRAPDGRHFYGHGAFSEDGSLLFTSENAYEDGVGMVGVWDASNGYRRVAEFPTGGVGPHDMRLMPDGATLIVANGGIETHPETGRAKLNIPTMRPNLSYLSLDGAVLDQVELEPAHRRNSIRHLAVAQDGAVAFAMQWQGDTAADLPLLGVHDRAKSRLQLAEDASVRRMNGYLGSVAITDDGASVAVTSPRENRLQVFRSSDLALLSEQTLEDVCGIAASGLDYLVTTGTGLVKPLALSGRKHPVQWDNHLVAI